MTNIPSRSDDALEPRSDHAPRTSVRRLAKTDAGEAQRLIDELQVSQIHLRRHNDIFHEAHVELAQTRDRYTDLLTFVPLGLMTLDNAGRILEANPAAEKLLAVSCETLIGHHVAGFVPSKFHSSYFLHLRSVFAEPHMKQSCDLELQRADGRCISVQLESLACGREDDLQCRVAIIEKAIHPTSYQGVPQSERRLDLDAIGLAELNEAIASLWHMRSLSDGLNALLKAMITLLGADMGYLQLLDADRRVLTIAAQHGFDEDFLHPIHEISTDGGLACCRAIRLGERVIIHDVNTDLAYAAYTEMAHQAGYRAVQSTPLKSHDGGVLGVISTHFRSSHVPTEQQLRRLDLYAQLASDFISRCQSDAMLRDREERLRTVLDTAADSIVTINHRGIVTKVNKATERMFGYSASELLGQNVKLLMPDPYREEHDSYLARYKQTGVSHVIGNGREVMGRKKDGSTFPIDLAVSEVDHLGLFTGIMRDISERKRLERDILSIAEGEQQRIGQDLHDGTQQTLAGLGMMSQAMLTVLAHLQATCPNTLVDKCLALAKKMEAGIAQVHHELQAVSRGLVPVLLTSQGLANALQNLASRTDDLDGVSCTFHYDTHVAITDSLVATNLFRIVQEALTNALKHGRPKHILISLGTENGLPILKIEDDGSGFDPSHVGDGMGLKTMRYRASVIGANLTISQVQSGGTLVTCRIVRGITGKSR